VEIGERLKYLRKELLDLTLDAFGNRIGLKKSTLSNIENGTYNLTDQTRLSIIREFQVNEQWLLTGEGNPFVKRTRQAELEAFFKDVELGDNEFKKAFIEGLAKLTTEEWVTIEKICKKMADGNLSAAGSKPDTVPDDPDSKSTEELETIYKNKVLPELSEKERTMSGTSEEEGKAE